MISIRDLTVAYIPNSPTLNGLSVQFEAAKIHAIVGLNGSGKTTLLNTIYKLIKPKHGDILYNNLPINQRQIAYLPTENFFYSNITGAEYLALFRNPHFDLAAWNALFKLSLDTSIDTYSTGMRKKLAILSVLKQEKPILILDEPFNGLDIETNRILHLILLKLKEKGTTILITSHIVETLTSLSDYIHYLEHGNFTHQIAREHFDEFEKILYQNIEDKNTSIVDNLI